MYKRQFVCIATYSSFVNQLSNIWDIGVYYLQQQNISKTVRREIPDTESSIETTSSDSSLDIVANDTNDTNDDNNDNESSVAVKENIEFDLDEVTTI